MSDFKADIRFKLSCGKCGSNDLTIPDDATDDSHITCGGCGADVGRWGDARASMIAATKKSAEESIKKAFGNGFKIDIKF